MYECSICLSLNHDIRLHCQNCGTIPAKYSVIRRPTKIDTMTETVIAIGAIHSCKHHAARINLRTVSADYYATE